VRAGAPGSVSVSQGNSVPLGLTPPQLLRRLGPPAASLRRSASTDCMLYQIVGQPAQVRLQFCFSGGRLKLLSTYLGR